MMLMITSSGATRRDDDYTIPRHRESIPILYIIQLNTSISLCPSNDQAE
jgi:hypothetical protein